MRRTHFTTDIMRACGKASLWYRTVERGKRPPRRIESLARGDDPSDVRRAGFARYRRHHVPMEDPAGGRPEDRTHLLTARSHHCGDSGSPWVHRRHTRPERFRSGTRSGAQPVGATADLWRRTLISIIERAGLSVGCAETDDSRLWQVPTRSPATWACQRSNVERSAARVGSRVQSEQRRAAPLVQTCEAEDRYGRSRSGN